MHSRLRLLLFFSSFLFSRPLFDNSAFVFSKSFSVPSCLSLTHERASFLFFFFFSGFRVAFQNSFHALGLCEKWDHQHWGVPHLLACYLVSSSIKSIPQILPPPSLSLFMVSPAVDPDEEGSIWGTVVSNVKAWMSENEDCVLKSEALRRDRGPWHNSIPDVCRPWIIYQLPPCVAAITRESDPNTVTIWQRWAILINPCESS